jgi:hypothetical protein
MKKSSLRCLTGVTLATFIQYKVLCILSHPCHQNRYLKVEEKEDKERDQKTENIFSKVMVHLQTEDL